MIKEFKVSAQFGPVLSACRNQLMDFQNKYIGCYLHYDDTELKCKISKK